jgi:fluoroquinolone resistance protein
MAGCSCGIGRDIIGSQTIPMIAMDAEQIRTKINQGSPVESARLGAIDWHDFDGEGARFIGCSFQEAQFGGTNFAFATFARCHFVRCRFSHADLREAVFDDCQFLESTDPTGCAFTFSDLRRAKFLKCDLSLCEIERSDLFFHRDGCLQPARGTLPQGRFQSRLQS